MCVAAKKLRDQILALSQVWFYTRILPCNRHSKITLRPQFGIAGKMALTLPVTSNCPYMNKAVDVSLCNKCTILKGGSFIIFLATFIFTNYSPSHKVQIYWVKWKPSSLDPDSNFCVVISHSDVLLNVVGGFVCKQK